MFKSLFSLILPRRKALALAALVGALASLSTVGLMGLAGWLVASAALQPPLYTLTLAITGVRFCGIFRAVFRYLERLLTHKVGFAFFNDFRQQILGEMIALVPFKVEADRGNVYDAVVNAVDKMRDAFLRFFLPPVTALICGLIVAGFMGRFHWLLGLWFVMLALVFIVIMPYFVNRIYRKLPSYDNGLTQEIMEMYTGQVEMAVYDYAPDKLLKATAMVKEYQRITTVHNRLKAKVGLLTELSNALAFVLSIALGIYLYKTGVLTGVWCIMMILAVQALLEFYQAVPPLMEWVWESREAYGLLKRYSTKKPEDLSGVVTCDYENAPHLAAKQLGFGYDEMILANMDFSVEKGDKVLILGASGSGKSTLFYILTKLLNYQQGSLGFGDLDYTFWTEDELRKRFAPAFQEHHLFEGTVRENFLLLHPGITDEEILQSLRQVGSRIFNEQKDLDYVLVDDGANISGGQRHGLLLAMVLAKARDVILLDEPTAGLDLKTAGKLLGNIMQDYSKHTLIVSSHDLSVLNYFDKVIILGDNTIAEQGEIKTLLAQPDSALNKLMKYENVV